MSSSSMTLSTDDSAAVAAGLAERDPRIEVRGHEANRGHIATYNEGLLGWADGDYTVLLSADDLVTPGAFARAGRAMTGDRPSVGLVYGRSEYFLTNDELPPIGRHQLGVKVWAGRQWLERRCRSGVSVISSPEVVVRSTVQRRVGGYRPDLPHVGDLEMWLRIAAVSDIVYVRGIAQAYYRRHPNSMLRTQYNTALADLRQRKAAYDSFFAEYGTTLSGVDDLQRRADLGHSPTTPSSKPAEPWSTTA